MLHARINADTSSHFPPRTAVIAVAIFAIPIFFRRNNLHSSLPPHAISIRESLQPRATVNFDAQGSALIEMVCKATKLECGSSRSI